MQLNEETRKKLAEKIVSHVTDMLTEDDFLVGAVAGGVFRENPEGEKNHIQAVVKSEDKHNAAIGVAARLLGFDRSQTADVLRQSAIAGADPIEAILARSTK